MFKEYALYKANRDMLDKRYDLKTEEQRVRDSEFKQRMAECKQKLEIEMEDDKKGKIEEVEKKADEAAMVKYKDTIDKLRKDIDDRLWDLESKDEENKQMGAIIKELETYKSKFVNTSSEQLYNYMNSCQAKFDKDFKLSLDDLRQQKQQDTLGMLCVSKLPNIKRINLGKFINDDKSVCDFLKNSFPDELSLFSFNWNCIAEINLKYYSDALAKCLPKVTKEVYLNNLKMDYDDLSAVVKASSQTQRLVINQCTIKPPGKLDFSTEPRYNLRFLSFRYSGYSDCCNWGVNKKEFEDILYAINSSGLKQSLKEIDLYNCGVDSSKFAVGKAKIVELSNYSPPLED